MDAAKAFAASLTFQEFVAGVRVHQHEIEDHYARLAVITDELRGHSPLTGARILAICEEWCVDNVLNLPIIARLIEVSDLASLRIVHRPNCIELANSYPGRGGVSRVPTLLFLNDAGGVIGYWSERSASEHRWFEAFIGHHPMPALEFEEGIPTPRLMDWMKLRIASERQRIYDGVWREVLKEIRSIAREVSC